MSSIVRDHTHSRESEEKLLQMWIFRQTVGYQVSRTQMQSLRQGQVEHLCTTEKPVQLGGVT